MFIKEDNMKYDDDAAVAGVRNVGPVASGGHLSLLVTSVEIYILGEGRGGEGGGRGSMIGFLRHKHWSLTHIRICTRCLTMDTSEGLCHRKSRLSRCVILTTICLCLCLLYPTSKYARSTVATSGDDNITCNIEVRDTIRR